MDIDRALDRLEGRLRREGLAIPGPTPEPAIAEAEVSLAPLRLPDSYLRLLRRMDPGKIPVDPFPSLNSLPVAVDGWHGDRRWGTIPRILFSIAYSSHTWLAVELASDRSPGGELYWWSAGDDFCHLVGGLAAWLDEVADAPAEGSTGYGRLWLSFDAAQLASGATVELRPKTWPGHWLYAEGFEPADLAPQGATTTIHEILAARDRGPVHERIHARVVAVIGTAGEWIVTVADHTGSMILRWPTATGPAQARVRANFELEIQTDPSQRTRPDRATAADAEQAAVQHHALAGDTDAANQAAGRMQQAWREQGRDGVVVAARAIPHL